MILTNLVFFGIPDVVLDSLFQQFVVDQATFSCLVTLALCGMFYIRYNGVYVCVFGSYVVQNVYVFGFTSVFVLCYLGFVVFVVHFLVCLFGNTYSVGSLIVRADHCCVYLCLAGSVNHCIVVFVNEKYKLYFSMVLF